MDEQPLKKGILASMVRFLKVDPTALTSATLIRPTAEGTLPRRIPFTHVDPNHRQKGK